MGYPHKHMTADPEAPMTQGQALMLLERMERIEGLLQQQVSDKPATVSVGAFARITGLSRSTVTMRLNTGQIKGTKPFGRTSKWMIPYSEVERINGTEG